MYNSYTHSENKKGRGNCIYHQNCGLKNDTRIVPYEASYGQYNTQLNLFQSGKFAQTVHR